MSDSKDVELAAGASLGATSILASNIPAVGGALASVTAHAGAISGAAHIGISIAAAPILAPALPFIAIGGAVYAIARLCDS